MNAKKIATWSLIAALMPTLAGCFGVAAVGMGAGALMLADRRPSETYLTDEGIEIRAGKGVDQKYNDKVHVNITSYNRTVLITGEVPRIDRRGSAQRQGYAKRVAHFGPKQSRRAQ